METYPIWDFSPGYGREPILRRMPDDSLICLFLTGGPREPDNANVVAVSRSRDDGATWTPPETLFSHSERGVWATELFTGGEKPMIALQTYYAPSVYRELQSFCSFTEDAGKTWSEPASYFGGLNGVTLRQGIVLSNGDWLFPQYGQRVLGGFDWKKPRPEGTPDYNAFFCGVAISRDGGRSFLRCGDLWEDGSLWEPNCVETEPGHVIMFMRSSATRHLKRSDSFDYGVTWSAPEDSGIPNADTKVTLAKVGDTVLLINNFNEGWDQPVWPGARTHLEIRASRDGCRTWEPCCRLADPEEPWFYPHALVDTDRRTLYVAYENAKCHRLAKIPLAELGL